MISLRLLTGLMPYTWIYLKTLNFWEIKIKNIKNPIRQLPKHLKYGSQWWSRAYIYIYIYICIYIYIYIFPLNQYISEWEILLGLGPVLTRKHWYWGGQPLRRAQGAGRCCVYLLNSQTYLLLTSQTYTYTYICIPVH